MLSNFKRFARIESLQKAAVSFALNEQSRSKFHEKLV